MPMTTSAAGRAALAAREGCRLEAYRDTMGVWTIGIGHTGRAAGRAVTPGLTIDRREAEALFAGDLKPFEAAVDDALGVAVTQGQFDALVSLAFNIGAGRFAGSTVVRELNAGRRDAAADAFLLWCRPPELKPRRLAERAQFLAPADPPGPTPPPAAPVAARKPGLLDRLWIALTFRKQA